MAHKTKINGTTYTIKSGRTKISGTTYKTVQMGKTKISGTAKNIFFPVTLTITFDSNTNNGQGGRVVINGNTYTNDTTLEVNIGDSITVYAVTSKRLYYRDEIGTSIDVYTGNNYSSLVSTHTLKEEISTTIKVGNYNISKQAYLKCEYEDYTWTIPSTGQTGTGEGVSVNYNEFNNK